VPPRDWRDRLEDILEAIDRIQSYTAGMGNSSFEADQKTIDAVVRNIIIIGEAAGMVSEEVSSQHPELPWHQMRGIRNVVVHQYAEVDASILWETIRRDLPPLKANLRKVLDSET
jgi:uncharacterized protein with HEPN domain